MNQTLGTSTSCLQEYGALIEDSDYCKLMTSSPCLWTKHWEQVHHVCKDMVLELITVEATFSVLLIALGYIQSDVTNHSLVVDPSIAPPGFDLRRRLWSTLYHFRTGQGRRAANLVRWNQTSDPSCSCGASLQTMLHIVNDCPDMKFPGGLSALHLAEEEAVSWLGMQSTR